MNSCYLGDHTAEYTDGVIQKGCQMWHLLLITPRVIEKQRQEQVSKSLRFDINDSVSFFMF